MTNSIALIVSRSYVALTWHAFNLVLVVRNVQTCTECNLTKLIVVVDARLKSLVAHLTHIVKIATQSELVRSIYRDQDTICKTVIVIERCSNLVVEESQVNTYAPCGRLFPSDGVDLV